MVRVLILSVAVLAGGVAAWLSMDSSHEYRNDDNAENRTYDEILIAEHQIEAGEELDAFRVKWKRWPAEAASADLILKSEATTESDDFKGMFARTRLEAGEPIRKDEIKNAVSGVLSMTLQPGMRAISVKISAGNTAGNFILPNDRVDVIHTGLQSTRTTNGTSSQTILSNIRVLAIDQSIDGSERTSAIAGKTATLELSPIQVEAITAAQVGGVISLALRAFSDTEDTATRPENMMTRKIRVIKSGQTNVVTVNYDIGLRQ